MDLICHGFSGWLQRECDDSVERAEKAAKEAKRVKQKYHALKSEATQNK